MPDIDLSQIAGNLMPKLNPKQQGFITTYLDKSYQSKHAKLIGDFQTASTGIALALGRVRTVTDLLDAAARTKADFDQKAHIKSETATALTDLAQKKKKHAETLELMKSIKVRLEQISINAEGYLTKVARTEGRDLGKNKEILDKKFEAQMRRSELDGQFGQLVAAALLKVQTEAPGITFKPEALTAFNEAFKLFGSEIINVPDNDPEVTTKAATKTLDGIKTRMQQTFDTQKTALENEVKGTAFQTLVSDLKLKDAIEKETAKTRDWLALLDRWETAARGPIREQLLGIEAEMLVLFDGQPATSPGELTERQNRQQAVLKAAADLNTRAGKVAEAEGELFAQQQALLLARLVGLENRFKAVASKVPEEQRTPIADTLATTRLSITGLNGANLDALKAAETLLDEALQLVGSAEQIRVINGEIEAAIKLAEKDANASKSEKNPLHAQFTDFLTEIATFKTEWRSKVPTAAKSEITDLVVRIGQAERDNQALISRRAQVQRHIELTEAELAKLDLAFKELAKGQPAEGMDYRGSLKGELDTCKSWNVTKTNITFYDSIDTKLNNLDVAIRAKLADIQKIKGMSDSAVQLAGLNADSAYKRKVEEINASDDDEAAKIEALRKAKEERDAELRFLNTKLDLLAEANAAIAVDKKEVEDREKFLTESKQLETDIEKEQKAAGKKDAINAYADEVKRHLDRLKTTRDMLREKPPTANASAALSELKFVKDTIQSIRTRGEKTSKSQLGAIADQWEKAADNFAKNCAKLMSAIETFEKDNDIDPPVSGEVQTVLTTVIGHMNNHQFWEPANILGAEDSSDADRKAAREKALAEVRRLRQVVLDDPVVQQCVMNPFGIGGLGMPVQYRLEEIELNVLRGV